MPLCAPAAAALLAQPLLSEPAKGRRVFLGSGRASLWSQSQSRGSTRSTRSSQSVSRCARASAWKPKDSKNIKGRAKSLLHRLQRAGDSRDEAVAVLDSWAAFQQDFPLLAAKCAIQGLREQGSWLRVVQVCKWMLQTGHGRTLNTYAALLEALSKLGREEEADAIWDLLLREHLEAVPRALFARVMGLHAERGRPLKVVELFGSMEALGMRLDEETLELVVQALGSVGAQSRADALRSEYTHERLEWRYRKGTKQPVRSFAPLSTREGVARPEARVG